MSNQVRTGQPVQGPVSFVALMIIMIITLLMTKYRGTPIKSKKPREEDIRMIAYNTWQEEGCGNGHDVEQWLKAEAIWENRRKQKIKWLRRILKKG